MWHLKRYGLLVWCPENRKQITNSKSSQGVLEDIEQVKGNIRWFEILLVRIIFEVDESWEQQYHISPFVHDWCSTIGAADFAGQLM